MKIFRFILLAGVCLPALAQTTWYVRPDGGERAVADGKADAPCVGTTPGQHCAFATWNNLFQDGTYTVGGSGATFPSWGWVIAGGDTVIIRGGPYRTGWQNSTTALDSVTGLYFGWQGDAYDGYNPPIPPGTTAQPTRILGENYATCNATNKTQIYGGYGLYGTLNLKGTQNVLIGCIELTRHSQCIQYGSPAVPAACGTGDDAAGNGILTDPTTANVTLQNDWIHGFTRAGMLGPIGGTLTLDNTQVQINGSAGINFDDGDGTVSPTGALLVMKNASAIDWSGCNQAYPGGTVLSCYSQSTGGYGDAIGTPDGSCIGVNIDHSFFRHNIQDAVDTLHSATTKCPYTLTNNHFEANQGEDAKWGDGSTPVVITNNIFIHNCARNSATVTGIPAAFNANLKDFCRALDTFTGHMNDGGSISFTSNTIITTASVTFDIACDTTTGCPNGNFTSSKNIILGYADPVSGPQPAGYFFTGTFPTTKTNNVFFGVRNFIAAPTEVNKDPLFVGEPSQTWTAEAALDNFSTALQTSSPAIALGAGASVVVIPPPVVASSIYPLTWTIQIPVAATTVTPAPVQIPAHTLNCTETQASATATPALGTCK